MHYGEYLESMNEVNTLDERTEAEKMLDQKYEAGVIRNLRWRIESIEGELDEIETRKENLLRHLSKKKRDYARKIARYREDTEK